jgi:DNA-binding helix-hairpin-helix protein with protein kinase domain
MSGHTPGPWMLSRGAQADAFAVEAASRTVAHVKHAPESGANADLIAAAPDLLAALLDVETVMARAIYPKPDAPPEHPWSVLQRVRGAIAKADGR